MHVCMCAAYLGHCTYNQLDGRFEALLQLSAWRRLSLRRLCLYLPSQAVKRRGVAAPRVGLGSGSGEGELSSGVSGTKVYGFGGSDEELLYGTSCSWHPTRDVVVVGYSDGAMRTVGLTRPVGGSGASC
ncbi:hypothetical protein Vafri_21353 [Volvox africanus]|uniref:Uncharacterized protein n=1 Tax=Volvox africanus TaxID=51714 RepID=A0A8J4BTC0_9CHLO|nr:hypothetical protein Vafri_21353 [Volvox africanus]